MTLTAKVAQLVAWTHTSPLDLSTPMDEASFKLANVEFTAGTGAGKVDLKFTDTRTLAASTPEVLDLAGVLVDAFGAVITFVKIKALIITAAAGNTNNVVVGPDATAGWVGPFGDASDRINIPPGGYLALVHPGDGWAVGAGATDELYVLNGGAGTSVTYSILILGASA